jgi:hypothetical protein
VALNQASGTFGEAAHNLKLCRTASAEGTKTQFASLRVVKTITATIE